MSLRLGIVVMLMAGAGAAMADELAPFKLLRSEEDYSQLRDPALRAASKEPYKYLPLGANPDFYVTLGGELRERVDHVDAARFGIAAPPDSYLLERLLVHADVHVGDGLRVYAELGRHDAFGKRTPPSAVDADRQDVQQLFIDFTLDPGAHVVVRAGRQELMLNTAQRFLSIREGPNLRLSYDGIRATWQEQKWKLDAIALRPVQSKPGSFDDVRNHDQRIWGLYARTPWFGEGGGFDLYWLELDADNARYGVTDGKERRRSAGMHFADSLRKWDWDVDVAYQYGHFTDRAISALGLGLEGGFTILHPWRPRLAVRFDMGTGNASGSTQLRTFNPLFPKAAYFDESLLTSWGNLLAARISLSIVPQPGLTVQASLQGRWRQNASDAVYVHPLIPLRSTLATGAHHVSNTLGLDASWQVTRYWRLVGEYAFADAGNAITKAGGHDVNFGMLIAQFRF